MTKNRIFNIECPEDLEEAVLCLDINEFEDLKKEPGNYSNSKKSCSEFLEEAFLYDIKQKIAKELYKNGRNFCEIYKSIRKHVLECNECSEKYVNFLRNYVLRKIKQRVKEDADIPSLLEEVNNLPLKKRKAFYMNCLRKADLKYLKILDIKQITKYHKLDECLAKSFEKSTNPSLHLSELREKSLDYDNLFSVN